MSEWSKVCLGELIKVKHGFAFPGQFITSEMTDRILVTPGNFCIGGGFKQGKFKYFSSHDYPAEYQFLGAELIVTMTDLSKETDTLGYSAVVPSDGKVYLHNQRVGLIEPISDQSCLEFVYWLMRWRDYQEFIVNSASGTSVMHTSPSRICEFEFELPPLPEQKAIASVLSSLDDKIDLLHRQNKTLEAMAETLFRQWFIEEAKEDWVNVQLKDIVKQIKPGTNYQPKRLDSGIPFLNVRNLQNGQINLQGISFISQEEYERVHKAWKPEEGDVLISRIGTLGIVAVLGKRDMPMAVHYNMLVLKPSLTNTAFLYFLLRSQYFQEAYSSKARQSVQEYVAVEDAESIELKLPLNDAAFANKQDEFYCLFDKIRANLYQIQTLENLRDTLLPKLMSGEVRVQYQTEEVA